MKLLNFRSALATLLMPFAISAAVAQSSPVTTLPLPLSAPSPTLTQASSTFNTQCTKDSGKNYSLYFTVPTGGYEVSIVRATVKKGILNIAVKYTPPSGVATQALVTHRLRFAFESVLRPSRYTVTANGKDLGRPKPIDLRGRVSIQ